jgi:2,3-bisphosphoglycerate-independent phosphoglycerate mutase
VLFLLDGIGDMKNPDLGNKTPLQIAKVPMMDKIA